MKTFIRLFSLFKKTLHPARLAVCRPAVQWCVGVVVIFVVAVGIYLPVLKHDFVGDDFGLIVYNKGVTDEGGLSVLLKREFVLRPSPVKLSARPVTLLSLMIEHAVWGLNPFGYHLTNILLHGLNSALLFMLVMSVRRRYRIGFCEKAGFWFGRKLLKPRDAAAGVTGARWNAGAKQESNPDREFADEKPWLFPVAFLSGLIFALHPLQAEAVNIASFRADLLSAFFCLLSFLALTHSSYLASLVCFVLGLFSKETAVILPFVMLFYAWLFPFRSKSPVNPQAVRENIPSIRRSGFIFFAAVSGGIALLFLVYFWAERFQYPLYKVIFPVLTGNVSPLSSFSAYVNTLCLSFLHYCRMLAVPVNLSLEYQMSLPGTVFNIRVLLALALAAVAFAAFRFSGLRNLKFGLGFFFIAYLPVSGLVPLVNTVSDRYMYLPMAGFSLFLSTVLTGDWTNRLSGLPVAVPRLPSLPEWLRRPGVGPPAVIGVLKLAMCLAIICWYGARTVAESGRFKNMFTAYRAAAAVSPRNPNARYHLALAYMDRKDYSGAIREFESVMAIAPGYKRAGIWHLLGICSEELGDDGKARSFYTKALLVAPAKETFINLANLMQREGRADASAWLLKKSLRSFPDPVSSNNLGTYYARKKNFPEAIKYYRQAIGLQPGYTDAWLNLLNACEASGNPGMLRKETIRMAELFAENNWEVKAYAR